MKSEMEWDYEFSPQEWEACMKVLNSLKEDPNHAPDIEMMKGLVSKIYKNARKERRKETIEKNRQEDLDTKKQSYIFHYQTGIADQFSANSNDFLDLNSPGNCYACGEQFYKMHFFYHRLCPSCVSLHLEKREQKADLSGKIALVTGGRIKVGFATALKLLRDGAKVIVTTRFPNDALMEFSKESDFENWKDSLILYGLDLRSLKSIDLFIDYLYSNFESLDILINNAAQTIKYDSAYYNQLLQREKEGEKLLEINQGIVRHSFELFESGQLAQLPGLQSEAIIRTDIFNQPIDSRSQNSWTARLAEVDTVELLEVNLINNIAPFILNSRLKSLMEKSEFPLRFIINVTSSEGQFSYSQKTVFHPHTNMTKAALNMMTRTSAKDFAESGILMNSVDVGWVSTGNPIEKKKRLEEQGHVMPLDIYDAAARIYDPIALALNLNIEHSGQLFKNYKVVDW